jgi:hypothetical protein
MHKKSQKCYISRSCGGGSLGAIVIIVIDTTYITCPGPGFDRRRIKKILNIFKGFLNDDWLVGPADFELDICSTAGAAISASVNACANWLGRPFMSSETNDCRISIMIHCVIAHVE